MGRVKSIPKIVYIVNSVETTMKKSPNKDRIKRLSDKAFKLQCKVDELIAEVYALDDIAGEYLVARLEDR